MNAALTKLLTFPKALSCPNPKCLSNQERTTICRFCGTNKVTGEIPHPGCPYNRAPTCPGECNGRGFCLDVA